MFMLVNAIWMQATVGILYNQGVDLCWYTILYFKKLECTVHKYTTIQPGTACIARLKGCGLNINKEIFSKSN